PASWWRSRARSASSTSASRPPGRSSSAPDRRSVQRHPSSRPRICAAAPTRAPLRATTGAAPSSSSSRPPARCARRCSRSCAPSRAARREVAGLDVVLASDGPRGEHEAFVRAERLDAFPYLLAPELGMRWQVGKLPYAALIDAAGTLRGRGLVNTREHLESLFEAMERGVGSIQEFFHGIEDERTEVAGR